MPPIPSQPSGVFRDQALLTLLSERGAAVIDIRLGDTSMLPHLRGGDAVLVAPRVARPALGELLLYRQQDYWVIHRLLAFVTGRDGSPGLRTRGDGRNVLDPCLDVGDLLARVVAVRRDGSWRSLEGRPARVYARLVALHDEFWALAGVVARKVGLGGPIAAIDLGLLRLAATAVFPVVHRRIAPPAASGPAATV